MAYSAHTVATTNKFIRKETLAMIRKRMFLALLQSRGNILYGQSGTNIQWPIRHKRNSLNPFGDGDSSTFGRTNKRKKAILPWRAYTMPESINKIDKLMNRGNEAIIKLWSNKTQEMMDDFKDALPYELINIDGNLAANVKRVHGLESVFSATVNAGKFVGINNDTYAGLSTARGSVGGGSMVSGDWPTGVISGPEYDFFTPLVVDYTNTGWAATTKTWINTCNEVLRFAIVNTQRNSSSLDMFLLGKTLWTGFLNAQTNQQVQVKRGNDSTLVKLGFTSVNFDGVDLAWEDTVSGTVGYGLSFDKIKLHSMQSQLIEISEDFDIETSSDRILLDSYLQLQIESPRDQCKLAALS